ncbi:hypothetical protein Pmani_032432 [Petrolisthes manimaculis]|uniref:Uncharacterized protein n=1 Tax=Petrolisthes manimaculis TaxID=1843537 RepID=A0AAE1TRF8_9EUCA|nr:hypothetical protein Pmani_032432 [Petrolisthes manimaculis]
MEQDLLGGWREAVDSSINLEKTDEIWESQTGSVSGGNGGTQRREDVTTDWQCVCFSPDPLLLLFTHTQHHQATMLITLRLTIVG